MRSHAHAAPPSPSHSDAHTRGIWTFFFSTLHRLLSLLARQDLILIESEPLTIAWPRGKKARTPAESKKECSSSTLLPMLSTSSQAPLVVFGSLPFFSPFPPLLRVARSSLAVCQYSQSPLPRKIWQMTANTRENEKPSPCRCGMAGSEIREKIAFLPPPAPRYLLWIMCLYAN